jgi:hypothetical protein
MQNDKAKVPARRDALLEVCAISSSAISHIYYAGASGRSGSSRPQRHGCNGVGGRLPVYPVLWYLSFGRGFPDKGRMPRLQLGDPCSTASTPSSPFPLSLGTFEKVRVLSC